ncbi:haloacid dehalogenase-like hydrolase family protein [Anoxybacillus amylolyticus]|uniref:Haloacid dehalogenase-like hydrolase family protein n=1 Tax=Anoxybacteroides amylolyticum TaxID=294699 RepID=A0A160F1R4_9BACL|nr:haloacid dehalogenase-like hydrolase family protein [Anoxybacillus amylolyticus]
MVIGDSLNDLSMFAVAGYRVAMGNAAEEVKQQADVITVTNDEDGVAVALEQLYKCTLKF